MFRACCFFLELPLSACLRCFLVEAIGIEVAASARLVSLRFLLMVSASIVVASLGGGIGLRNFCIPRSAKAASCSAFMTARFVSACREATSIVKSPSDDTLCGAGKTMRKKVWILSHFAGHQQRCPENRNTVFVHPIWYHLQFQSFINT